MLTARRELCTEKEYLVRERASPTRHEFVNGEILAMAGGSKRHSAIGANVIMALGNLLRGKPCQVYSSDLRVGVPATGLYAYPDATVICGPPLSHPKDPDTVTNPTLIVEVLSPSSELYDRGAKFAHYQRMPSLQEYLLVAQDEQRVEHFRRLASGQWLYTECRAGTFESQALGGGIALADLYDKVDFSAAAPEPASIS